MKNKLLIAVVLIFLSRLFAQQESATLPEEKIVFKINYLSIENLYLKGGRVNGLHVGDRLGILRNKDLIAVVEVVFLANFSASCKILKANQNIESTDVAVLFGKDSSDQKLQAEGLLADSSLTIPIKIEERKPSLPFARLSGTLSVQYYHLRDQTANGLDFAQTTFRINATARKLWGKDFNLRIRTRIRQNRRVRDYLANNIPASEFRNRVYELSFGYDNRNAPFNFQLGRIYSMPLSGVGNVDGGQFQLNVSRNFRAGILAGSQPNMYDSGVQTSLHKYGLYVNYASGDFGPNLFASTIAGVAEYQGSTVSRQFLYLQNSYSGGRLNLFQSLELDINSQWRKERAGKSIALSNLYFAGRYRFSNALSTGIIFDRRKNYYTIEYMDVDDFFFDDFLRTGLRGNISLRLPGDFRLFGEAGVRWWEKGHNLIKSFSAGLSRDRFLFQPLSFNLFGSRDLDLLSDGFTAGGQIEWRFIQGHRLEFSYFRYDYRIKGILLYHRNEVYRLGAYWMLLRHIFLSGQFESARGDDLDGPRLSLEMGYIF